MNEQIDHWERLSTHPPDASVIDPRDRLGHKNRYITSLRNDAILSAFDGGSVEKVLDFGCGTGGLSQALAASGRAVLGVDISPGLLRRTSEREHRDRCLFVRFDGVRLPVQDNALDAAATYVVLNHILDDAQLTAVLTEIHRVLRSGGKLVAIEQVRTRPTVDQVAWQHRRTIAGFQAIFEQAGFSVQDTTIVRYGRLPTIHAVRYGMFPHRWFRALNTFERWLGRAIGVLPWDYCDVCFELSKA